MGSSRGAALPLRCFSIAFVAEKLPLPCVSTAFVTKPVPFLAVLRYTSVLRNYVREWGHYEKQSSMWSNNKACLVQVEGNVGM